MRTCVIWMEWFNFNASNINFFSIPIFFFKRFPNRSWIRNLLVFGFLACWKCNLFCRYTKNALSCTQTYMFNCDVKFRSLHFIVDVHISSNLLSHSIQATSYRIYNMILCLYQPPQWQQTVVSKYKLKINFAHPRSKYWISHADTRRRQPPNHYQFFSVFVASENRFVFS